MWDDFISDAMTLLWVLRQSSLCPLKIFTKRLHKSSCCSYCSWLGDIRSLESCRVSKSRWREAFWGVLVSISLLVRTGGKYVWQSRGVWTDVCTHKQMEHRSHRGLVYYRGEIWERLVWLISDLLGAYKHKSKKGKVKSVIGLMLMLKPGDMFLHFKIMITAVIWRHSCYHVYFYLRKSGILIPEYYKQSTSCFPPKSNIKNVLLVFNFCL